MLAFRARTYAFAAGAAARSLQKLRSVQARMQGAQSPKQARRFVRLVQEACDILNHAAA
jgi:hypothetical protein